jgi:hypothetical protein
MCLKPLEFETLGRSLSVVMAHYLGVLVGGLLLRRPVLRSNSGC